MFKLDNDTKIPSYKLVSPAEGKISFRKNGRSHVSPIVETHEYLDINSTNYCVS